MWLGTLERKGANDMEAEFFKGLQVRITGNHCGHGHQIGEIVTLKKATVNPKIPEYWSLESKEWVFSSDECEPIRKKGRV